MQNPFHIDGFGPLPVVRPISVAELSLLVLAAGADRALYPVGGGTMLTLGLPPTKPGTAVDLRGLDQVIDYPARDMTITVQAGIPIAKVREVLRGEGQQLSVDVPLPDRATLGGAIATNASGPRRFGYGTLRDYVIGISLMNDLGEEVKGGGRVVKNVAGYDMMKLYTGSLGTLGIVTQVTLKVKPLPEAAAIVLAPCSPNALPENTTRFLARTKTRPTAVSVANAIANQLLGSDSTVDQLLIAFEEKKSAVEWQLGELKRDWPSDSAITLRDSAASDVLARWADFPLAEFGPVTFKANVVPAETASFFRKADGVTPRPALMAHLGNGIVTGHFPADATREQIASAVAELNRWAESARGNVVLTRCPPEWKSTLPVWGRSTADRKLMRTIKDKLDPRRVFNPGRFVDGI